jgi:hypothetical protein
MLYQLQKLFRTVEMAGSCTVNVRTREKVDMTYVKVPSQHLNERCEKEHSENSSQGIRLEVFTVKKIQVVVFWVVMACSDVEKMEAASKIL